MKRLAFLCLLAFACGASAEDEETDVAHDQEPKLGLLQQDLASRKSSSPGVDARWLGVRVASGRQCGALNTASDTCLVPNSRTIRYMFADAASKSNLKSTVDGLIATWISATNFTFTEVTSAQAGDVVFSTPSTPDGAGIKNFVSFDSGCPSFCSLLQESLTGTYAIRATQMNVKIDAIKAFNLCGGTVNTCYTRTLRHALSFGMYNRVGLGSSDATTPTNHGTHLSWDTSVDKVFLPGFQQCLAKNFDASNPASFGVTNANLCNNTFPGY